MSVEYVYKYTLHWYELNENNWLANYSKAKIPVGEIPKTNVHNKNWIDKLKAFHVLHIHLHSHIHIHTMKLCSNSQYTVADIAYALCCCVFIAYSIHMYNIFGSIVVLFYTLIYIMWTVNDKILVTEATPVASLTILWMR